MAPEKYKPTQEEIAAAENRMTPVQKRISATRNKMAEAMGGPEKLAEAHVKGLVIEQDKDSGFFPPEALHAHVKGHDVKISYWDSPPPMFPLVKVDGVFLSLSDGNTFMEKYEPIFRKQLFAGNERPKQLTQNELEAQREHEEFAAEAEKTKKYERIIKDLLD